MQEGSNVTKSNASIPEGDGMVPPVAQLRPRNSGRDFFWDNSTGFCHRTAGPSPPLRGAADYSLSNTFYIWSSGSSPATQAPKIRWNHLKREVVHRCASIIEYKTENIYSKRILFMDEKIVITPKQCLGAFYEI